MRAALSIDASQGHIEPGKYLSGLRSGLLVDHWPIVGGMLATAFHVTEPVDPAHFTGEHPSRTAVKCLQLGAGNLPQSFTNTTRLNWFPLCFVRTRPSHFTGSHISR